jgi:hypothetical protein
MRFNAVAVVVAFALSSCASEPNVLKRGLVAQDIDPGLWHDGPCAGVPAIPDVKTAIRQADLRVGYVPFEDLVGKAEYLYVSTNGTARLWEVWKWFSTVRYERSEIPFIDRGLLHPDFNVLFWRKAA